MKAQDTLLYLDGVSVSFDGFRAINNLSLVLQTGEMRAIIGPNGAGKTTMMDIITGQDKTGCWRRLFQWRSGSDQARRGGNRFARYRPQISEADGFRKPHG